MSYRYILYVHVSVHVQLIAIPWILMNIVGMAASVSQVAGPTSWAQNPGPFFCPSATEEQQLHSPRGTNDGSHANLHPETAGKRRCSHVGHVRPQPDQTNKPRGKWQLGSHEGQAWIILNQGVGTGDVPRTPRGVIVTQLPMSNRVHLGAAPEPFGSGHILHVEPRSGHVRTCTFQMSKCKDCMLYDYNNQYSTWQSVIYIIYIYIYIYIYYLYIYIYIYIYKLQGGLHITRGYPHDLGNLHELIPSNSNHQRLPTFFSAQVTAKVICCTSAQRKAPATKRPQKASDQREQSRVGNPRDQSLLEMAGKWLGKGKFELFWHDLRYGGVPTSWGYPQIIPTSFMT